MNMNKLIPVNDFCINHNIETSFISSLEESGLIEITTLKKNLFLHIEQLQQIEKMICFHYELEINLEGIESITNLLNKIESLQKEVLGLKNILSIYETSM
jgi:chaperone modulatory protein CbpM